MAFSTDRTWATESGIDGRVFGVIAIIAMLVSVASGLAFAISGV